MRMWIKLIPLCLLFGCGAPDKFTEVNYSTVDIKDYLGYYGGPAYRFVMYNGEDRPSIDYLDFMAFTLQVQNNQLSMSGLDCDIKLTNSWNTLLPLDFEKCIVPLPNNGTMEIIPTDFWGQVLGDSKKELRFTVEENFCVNVDTYYCGVFHIDFWGDYLGE